MDPTNRNSSKDVSKRASDQSTPARPGLFDMAARSPRIPDQRIGDRGGLRQQFQRLQKALAALGSWVHGGPALLTVEPGPAAALEILQRFVLALTAAATPSRLSAGALALCDSVAPDQASDPAWAQRTRSPPGYRPRRRFCSALIRFDADRAWPSCSEVS
jgi:hypothetical protein